MNWLGIVTLLLGFIAFVIGKQIARKRFSRTTELFLLVCGVMLSLPAIFFAIYYFKILGEPIWLYQIRTITGSELLASFAGFLAGWLQVRLVPHLRVSRMGQKVLIPMLLGFGLALPYMKPLLRPLPKNNIPDQWRGAACMQSTPSTCGPASAATILNHFGQRITERQLATESFTSSSGTENWYLARALRRQGMNTSFLLGNPMEVSLPAIAGVRLKNVGNSGHFIALIGRDADQLIFSDPMDGFSTNTLAELGVQYEFTGFFLLIQPQATPEQGEI